MWYSSLAGKKAIRLNYLNRKSTPSSQFFFQTQPYPRNDDKKISYMYADCQFIGQRNIKKWRICFITEEHQPDIDLTIIFWINKRMN